MRDPLNRLYRLKSALLASLLVIAGVALLTIGIWAGNNGSWKTLLLALLIELGGGVFTTGLLGVGLQFFIDQDKAKVDDERLREAIADAAPAMRDAVIHGFAFEPDDLARVATPQVLDQIVENGLALRLGDAGFARDIYADLRQQTIASPERLHDARIRVHLSPLPAGRGTAKGRAPVFVATVRWELSLHPKYETRRFSCTSDRREFRELAQDKTANSAWFVNPGSGWPAGDLETFELLDFTVDGEPRKPRRSERDGGQTYSVGLGAEAMTSSERVALAYTYRTVLPIDDHLLRLRMDQPTHGLTIEFDYTNADIQDVAVVDFIAGSQNSRITRTPASVPERVVTIDCDGWAMPRSGVALVWARSGLSRSFAEH